MTGSVSLGEAGKRACEWCGPLPPHHQHILCRKHAKELRASCPSTASAKPRGAAILAGGGWAGWAAWTACRACGRMDGGRPCVAGPAGTVAFVARPRWGRGVGPPLGAARGAAGAGTPPPLFPSLPGSSQVQHQFTVRGESLPRGAGLQWRARSAGCSWVAAKGRGKEAAGAVGASGWVLSLPGR